MAVLLDTGFPGADVDPIPTAGSPFSKSSGPTLRQVSNTAAVSVANNFADIYDASNSYPEDGQWAEVTIGTLGGADFGPVVRDNGSQFYFLQNSDGTTIRLYTAFGFVLLYSVAGTWAATDVVALRAVGPAAATTLQMYVNGTLVGSHAVSGTAFAGGAPGMSGYDGAFRVSRLRTGDGAYPGPASLGSNITATSSANPRRGSAQTVTGTAFGATQGTKQLRVGGVAQTPTSWADTLIGYTLAADLVKSGIAVNVEIWETSPSAVLDSNSYALTSIQPSLGWSFVDVGTPNIVADNRLTFSADAVSGDQAEWETTDGSSEFTVDTDLTYVATGYGVFAARLWTTGAGYGAPADQTVNPPLPVLSAPGVSTFGSTTARPQVTITF